ncbi:MAG TPA: L,D-transpeptidase family protein [Chloroflexota bacterium]|nr:L,D-transpeptidase family protein [Chloroflexota bacterium]
MRRAVSLVGWALLVLLLAACGGSAGSSANPVQQLVSRTHKAPLAPTNLNVTAASGQSIAPNGWTNQSTVKLGATLASPEDGVKLVPEVEFVPASQPFTGTPNLTGSAGDGFVQTQALAAGQTYHWQIRAGDPGGPTGPWVPFEGTIGFDPTPPPSPSIATLPNDGYVSTKQVKLGWDAIAGKSGIAGYAYSADQSAGGAPPQQVNGHDTSATVTLGADGDWFFHVRTLDNAGNWSPTATAALHLDTQPLKITNAVYRTFAYNPSFDTLHINFDLSKAAKSVVMTILPDKSDTPIRTYDLGQQPAGTVRAAWDGKNDAGAVAPVGAYRFRVVAKDQNGNTADQVYDQLSISNKRIVVSLSQQKLWAYEGDKSIFDSLVTTGNPLLPTPEGTYQILSKQKDFTFHSPWPKGSEFWYPDSFTNYAMMFDTDGYFIHDAPWRHKFGPGSNLVAGQPGEDTSGTHGCVNVPLDLQAKLFAWTDLGTPVVIQQ